jgi:hypothetical protein
MIFIELNLKRKMDSLKKENKFKNLILLFHEVKPPKVEKK